MLIATAVDLCEKYGLKWHAILEDNTREYVRIVLNTHAGEYQLPLIPPVGYSDWHGNLMSSNSKVDGFVLTYILTKLKY